MWVQHVTCPLMAILMYIRAQWSSTSECSQTTHCLDSDSHQPTCLQANSRTELNQKFTESTSRRWLIHGVYTREIPAFAQELTVHICCFAWFKDVFFGIHYIHTVFQLLSTLALCTEVTISNFMISGNLPAISHTSLNYCAYIYLIILDITGVGLCTKQWKQIKAGQGWERVLVNIHKVLFYLR